MVLQKLQANLQSEPDCVKKLNKKYLSTYTEEDTLKSRLLLKSDCETYKAEAESCCSNPNSCNNFMKDLTQHLLPLTPALYQTISAYNASKDIASEKLTPEEASQKMCNVKNKTNLAIFGSQLLSQMTNAVQTTCKDRIKQCQSKCDGEVQSFKKEFKKCFQPFIPGSHKENLAGIVSFAKNCANISDIEESALNTIEETKNFVVTVKDVCTITFDSDCNTSTNCLPKSLELHFNLAIGHILLFAKAYLQSSLDNMHALSDTSNAEEIVKCSHQPKRVVTSRQGPGQPVASPTIDLCKRFVQTTLDNPPNPELLNRAQNTPIQPVNTPRPTGTFTGSTLLPPDEVPNGIVDEEELPPPFKKPEIKDKVAGWSNSNPGGSGGDPSGGNGSMGGADAPSLSSNAGGGDPYGRPYSSFGPSDTGMFSGSSGYMPGGGMNDYSGNGGMQMASNDRDGQNGLGAPYELPQDGQDSTSNTDNIFNSASKRIQTFCSDHKCDLP